MIVKYKLSGLWNSEYPLVVNRIIDIVEAHKPQTINLGLNFDLLAAYRTQLDKIYKQERADKDSVRLREIDNERDMIFKIIFSVSKTFQRSPITEIRQNATQVMNLLKKHGINISVANYTAETKRLYDLASDVNANPNIMASLKTLLLKSHFERMCELNKEFDVLFMQRNHKKAENGKLDIRSIRKECDKEITSFWCAIELCCKLYGKEKYMPMVNEINTLNSHYKQLIASRKTGRKTKNGDKKEEPVNLIECEVCDDYKVA